MNRLSCPDAHAYLADLLIADLAPESAAILDEHLQECPDCREHAESLLMQDRLLAELAGERIVDDMAARFRQAVEKPAPAKTVQPRKRIRVPAWGWVGAAASLLLIVGVVVLRQQSEEPTPLAAVGHLEQVSGEVYVVGKEKRTTAQSGQKLFPGERVQVGEEGTAVVTLSDSSRLDLGPSTSVSLPSRSSKGDPEQNANHIRLDEGSLVAHFSRDADQEPMTLITPHAEIVAGKTRFSLWNESDTTRIEMEEGTAEVTRRSDGKKVVMNSGTDAGAAIGRDVPLSPHPLSPRLRDTRQTFGPHPGGVVALNLSEDGHSLYVGSKSGEVRIWDLVAMKERLSFMAGTTAARGMALAPSEKSLVTGHEKSIRFWDTTTGQERFSGNKPVSGIYALGFTPDGKALLSGSFDRIIRRWDPTTGQLVSSVRCKDYQSDFDYPACMTFDHDATRLAWGLKDSTARVWDAVAGKQLWTLRGHDGAVTATAFSPDGLTLATGSRDRTVRLWDLSTGNLRATLRGHRHTVLSLAFSPDGRSLASGGADTVVNLWDVATGKERGSFKGHEKAVHAVVFTPDGRSLITAGADENVRLWDVP